LATVAHRVVAQIAVAGGRAAAAPRARENAPPERIVPILFPAPKARATAHAEVVALHHACGI